MIFARFAAGDEQALQDMYKTHYAYATGWLIYREKCPRDRADALYTDSVLRLRDKAMAGELEEQNLRAYLLKITINAWKMEQRRELSLLKRHERFLEQLPPHDHEEDFDLLLRSEEETGLALEQQRKTLAIRAAFERLSEACRQLLTDTIILGLKVGGLPEKFGLKDARGVTAKKQDCKNQLKRFTLERLG